MSPAGYLLVFYTTGNAIQLIWNEDQGPVVDFSGVCHQTEFNSYNPDVAQHINQLSKLLLRTHSTLECKANESVH